MTIARQNIPSEGKKKLVCPVQALNDTSALYSKPEIITDRSWNKHSEARYLAETPFIEKEKKLASRIMRSLLGLKFGKILKIIHLITVQELIKPCHENYFFFFNPSDITEALTYMYLYVCSGPTYDPKILDSRDLKISDRWLHWERCSSPTYGLRFSDL